MSLNPVGTITSTTFGHADIYGILYTGIMQTASGFPICNFQPTLVDGDVTFIFPHPHQIVNGAPAGFQPHQFHLIGNSFVDIENKKFTLILYLQKR